MKTVDEMIDDIIRREGGYVNHPADRGGPTKYGITQATLDRVRKPEHPKSVEHLTRIEAKAIYRDEYYLKPRIHDLPPALQPFMFDAAVNHGPAQAVKFLQAALCDLGRPTTVDGKIGPQTITNAILGVAASGSSRVLELLVEERRRFYHQIVAKNPSQEVFLKGWLNRLAEFEPAPPTTTVLKKPMGDEGSWEARAKAAEQACADLQTDLEAERAEVARLVTLLNRIGKLAEQA